jgi:hypothetical protein
MSKTVTPEEHLQILINALDAANKKGAFSLKEAEQVIASVYAIADVIKDSKQSTP